MANLVSSLIFGARNVDKSLHDNVARVPVAVGQGTNAIREIAKFDKDFASALALANETSSPLLKGFQKCANFASNNINPLICVAGGVKVLMSDDKEKEAINQAMALGVMFSAEKAYKAIADYKNVLSFANKIGKKEVVESIVKSDTVKNIVSKIGDKRLKTIFNVIYGLGFVTASISGYNLGEKIAKSINAKRDYNKLQNDFNMTQQALATCPVRTRQA